jgi:hypothetical protein
VAKAVDTALGHLDDALTILVSSGMSGSVNQRRRSHAVDGIGELLDSL